MRLENGPLFSSVLPWYYRAVHRIDLHAAQNVLASEVPALPSEKPRSRPHRGRDYYLGPYGSQESRDEYLRLLAEFSLPSPAATPDEPASPPPRVGLTIDELVNEYLKFAVQYYRDGDKPGKEYVEMRYAARPLRRLYGSSRAADFGPLKLKAVQRRLAEEKKLCRAVIDRRV